MPYQGRLPYTYKSPFNTTLDQGTQTVPSLAFLGDTNNGLFSPATDNVAITTNGSEKLRVTSAGNVGIGTTNPTTKLDVFVNGGEGLPTVVTGERMRIISNDVVGRSGYLSIIAGSSAYSGVFFGDKDSAEVGKIRYFHSDNSLQVLVNGSTEALRIKSDGNVGIGTTNPQTTLHVSGTIRMSAVPGTNTNANLAVLFQTTAGDIDGGSSLTFNPADDSLSINGMFINTNTVRANANGPLILTTANNSSNIDFRVTTTECQSKANLIPFSDNTYNLGSSTFRWANIYSADLQLSNEGSSNDVDGTWGAYTIQEGENDLYLLNRRNGKKYKFVLQEVN